MSDRSYGPALEVKLAKEMGFCFGVRRAVDLVEKLATDNNQITVLGSLVHNPQVIASLRQKGVRSAATVAEVTQGALVIPSHGAPPEVFDEARQKGLTVIDTTCPFVHVAQKTAANFVQDGYDVVILGDKNHTEVRGILGWAHGKAQVIDGPAGVINLHLRGKVAVLAQTTQMLGNLQAVVAKIAACALGDINELRVANTICGATAARQTAATELSKEVDVLIIVGGKESANTRRLLETGRAAGVEVHQVEDSTGIDMAWIAQRHVVGVTAGASTPDSVIKEVVEKLQPLGSS